MHCMKYKCSGCILTNVNRFYESLHDGAIVDEVVSEEGPVSRIVGHPDLGMQNVDVNLTLFGCAQTALALDVDAGELEKIKF